MSGGLFALLDDVAAIAKGAAATLDDAAAQSAKVAAKAAGIVIDDTAVTPRYVIGFAADRELPIVAKIAWGSLKNKLLYLLPAAIALSAFAPWAITPLLMAGGVFLCFEGYEKAHEWMAPHDAADTGPVSAPAPIDPHALEDEKVAAAIRTDMVLSAEIMAISLAAIETKSIAAEAAILTVVALLVTAGVYGAVALIVKADDVGVALAQSTRPVTRFRDILRRRKSDGEPTTADRRWAPLAQATGRGLVRGMPYLLQALSVIGTLAMLWVGGGIILHGLAQFGFAAPEHAIHAIGTTLGGWLPLIGGLVSWLIAAALAGLLGLGIGWAVVKVMDAVRGS